MFLPALSRRARSQGAAAGGGASIYWDAPSAISGVTVSGYRMFYGDALGNDNGPMSDDNAPVELGNVLSVSIASLPFSTGYFSIVAVSSDSLLSTVLNGQLISGVLQ